MKLNFRWSWVRYDLETIPQKSKFNMEFVRNDTNNMFSSLPILSIHQSLHQPKVFEEKRLSGKATDPIWGTSVDAGAKDFQVLDQPFNSGTWYFMIFLHVWTLVLLRTLQTPTGCTREEKTSSSSSSSSSSSCSTLDIWGHSWEGIW